MTVPAFAWLAATALQARLEGASVRPHWPSVLVMLVLMGYGFWVALVDDPHPRALLFLLGSGALATAALFPLARSRPPTPAALALLIALVAIDYRAFNIAQAFNAGPRSQPALAERRVLEHAFAMQDRDTRGNLIPLRADVHGIPSLLNGAVVHQLPLIDGYNPMYASRYARMTGIGPYPSASPDARKPTEWGPDSDAPLWDLLGLRATIASRPFADSVATKNGDYFVRVREVRLPRVLNPTRIRRHQDDLPVPATFNITDFTTELWLPQSGEATACPDVGAGNAQVDAVRYRASRIELDYRADTPAWLVINEVIAPGWVAEVEGRSVPLLRGNGLFRAVCVPAGRLRLVLRFSPARLWRDGWARWREGAVVAGESAL